jgi:hypothetical protein
LLLPGCPRPRSSYFRLPTIARMSSFVFFSIEMGSQKHFCPCYDPPYLSLCSWEDRHVPLHPAMGCDRVFEIFLPGWPGTAIFPISASQVAWATSAWLWLLYIRKTVYFQF